MRLSVVTRLNFLLIACYAAFELVRQHRKMSARPAQGAVTFRTATVTQSTGHTDIFGTWWHLTKLCFTDPQMQIESTEAVSQQRFFELVNKTNSIFCSCEAVRDLIEKGQISLLFSTETKRNVHELNPRCPILVVLDDIQFATVRESFRPRRKRHSVTTGCWTSGRTIYGAMSRGSQIMRFTENQWETLNQIALPMGRAVLVGRHWPETRTKSTQCALAFGRVLGFALVLWLLASQQIRIDSPSQCKLVKKWTVRGNHQT